jgi:polyphenol oxidase
VSALAFAADWPAPLAVRAFQTVRDGGVSNGGYRSLNVGDHVGDDPGRVAVNRRRLRSALELPAEPVWLQQVHGTQIADLDRAFSGPADGAVTSRSGVVCAIMTADCLPVLFADRGGRRVGAAHAGWRGMAAGVLDAAVAAMSASPSELLAWLGPAIGHGAYEVGAEVREAFVARDPSADEAFTTNERGRWQADLYALARRQLRQLGVESIYGGGLCTASDERRFFSHRREAPCGRMATLIWLLPCE